MCGLEGGGCGGCDEDGLIDGGLIWFEIVNADRAPSGSMFWR